MTLKDILFVTGAIAALAMTFSAVKFWLAWRRKALTSAGKAFGFHRVPSGQRLSVVLVPLIERPNQSFSLILKGLLSGYEAAFFDLFHSSGRNWDLQSTVLVRNPELNVPKFQLRPKSFWQNSPRPCDEPVNLPNAEENRLELSSDDSEWARGVFSEAASAFFEKVRRGKWAIEGRRNSVVVYRLGTRIAPANLEEYLEEAAALAMEIFVLSAIPTGARDEWNAVHA